MGEQISYGQSEAIEENKSGNLLRYIAQGFFGPLIKKSNLDPIKKTKLFAQMARFNTLYMIARAGSGHLGSSFSSLDIVSYLYLEVLQGDDRYFSSKGHDAPGLYSVLMAVGIQKFELIHELRRLNGLPGHPVVEIDGMITNTGSLGMGVSKAKGFLFSDEILKKPSGHIYAMFGDGEIQEGQFWESLQGAGRLRNGLLTIIIDHNKIQSDTFVSEVNDLGDLEAKFAAFGMEVRRCNGNDVADFSLKLQKPTSDGRPLVIIADTVKGNGVSFMEHTAMGQNDIYYKYHSGAPTPDEYIKAAEELTADIRKRCLELEVPFPEISELQFEPINQPENSRRMLPVYSEALLSQAKVSKKIVALDADLVLDTGLIPFKNEFPERFFECGIAEQDMVSQAGTMALSGLMPIVHSFSCFLTSRPTEQIFNNFSEHTKIIYVGSLAGLLPAGPGHSHQSVHDFSTMCGMPGFSVVEPLSVEQIAPILDWALHSNRGSTYIRLTSIPYKHKKEFEGLQTLKAGAGYEICDGDDATMISTNSILTAEAIEAAALLKQEGISLKIIATPWINNFDAAWYSSRIKKDVPLLTLENHFLGNGFGPQVLSKLAEAGLLPNSAIKQIGISSLPQSGRNDEVLAIHGLNAEGIAQQVRSSLKIYPDTSRSG